VGVKRVLTTDPLLADDVIEALAAAADEYLRRTALPGEKVLVAQGSPALAIAAAATRLDASFVVVAPQGQGQGLATRFALGSTHRSTHAFASPAAPYRSGH